MTNLRIISGILPLRTGCSSVEQASSSMQIHLKDDGKKGAFYIEADDKVVAEMAFVWAGEQKLIIDHTDVDASLKGKGAGKQLVHQAVVLARERNIKILPLCPFAKSVFDKTPEYADVLD